MTHCAPLAMPRSLAVSRPDRELQNEPNWIEIGPTAAWALGFASGRKPPLALTGLRLKRICNDAFRVGRSQKPAQP